MLNCFSVKMEFIDCFARMHKNRNMAYAYALSKPLCKRPFKFVCIMPAGLQSGVLKNKPDSKCLSFHKWRPI